jgi:integrase
MLKAMNAIGKPDAWAPNEALRHCYGTRTAERLLKDGNRQHDAMRLIMTIMGHTSVETSRRYVQLATESLREGVE